MNQWSPKCFAVLNAVDIDVLPPFQLSRLNLEIQHQQYQVHGNVV